MGSWENRQEGSVRRDGSADVIHNSWRIHGCYLDATDLHAKLGGRGFGDELSTKIPCPEASTVSLHQASFSTHPPFHFTRRSLVLPPPRRLLPQTPGIGGGLVGHQRRGAAAAGVPSEPRACDATGVPRGQWACGCMCLPRHPTWRGKTDLKCARGLLLPPSFLLCPARRPSPPTCRHGEDGRGTESYYGSSALPFWSPCYLSGASPWWFP
ncbi:hypothetical protein HU200_038501 [Digitaria exilis]|uniref:Uncharacterized protein n=1 Tax=Digitaria exilis TaxID=1010633 RepID=A0A835EJ55_9POAL|nr:hypothetical protein HU200_038501 [Digitaria exilis]